eukprot:Hpha_TRINITY_DN14925_c1_g4::TRINITY_DN14925_c1_g4_i1::g.145033::m.145033
MSVGQMSGGVNFLKDLTSAPEEGADQPEDEDERQRLVGVVKNLLLKNATWKEKYIAWATENAEGNNDPGKMSLMQLIAALTELGTEGEDIIHAAIGGQVQETPTPAQDGDDWGGEPELDEEHAALVQKVKDRQRQNHIWKEQWWAYIRRVGKPEKDPMRHSKDFLKLAIPEVDKEAELASTGAQITESGIVRLPDIAGYFMEDLLVAAIQHYDAYGGIEDVTQFITDFIATRAEGGPNRGGRPQWTQPPEKRFRGEFY